MLIINFLNADLNKNKIMLIIFMFNLVIIELCQKIKESVPHNVIHLTANKTLKYILKSSNCKIVKIININTKIF